MKFILLSPKNRTAYNFRGDFIKELVSKGYEVVVTGPDHTDVEKIEALGARFERKGDAVSVAPIDRAALPASPLLDCGESGSTLRFMLPVAAGMAVITRACVKTGFCEPEALAALETLLRRFGLPERCPYGAQEIYLAALGDKKRSGEYINYVVLESPGSAKTVRMSKPEFRAFLEKAVPEGV